MLGEVVHLRVAARIDKGQHGDGIGRGSGTTQPVRSSREKQRGNCRGAGDRRLIAPRWPRRRQHGRPAQGVLQRQTDIPRRLVPRRRIFFEAPRHEPIESVRNGRADLRQRRGFTLENIGHRLRGRLAGKGPASRDHLVQHAAERKDIARSVRGDTANLLGRHIPHRTHDRAGVSFRRHGCVARCGVRRPPACEAEVQNLDAAAGGQEEILGLQIAVNDSLAMSRPETIGNSGCDFDGLAPG